MQGVGLSLSSKPADSFSWCVLSRGCVWVRVCACACARPRKLQHGWTLVHAGTAVRWTATDSRANVTLRHLLSFTAGITAYPCSAADTCARRAWCQRTAPPSAMSFAQPSASTDTRSTAHSHSLTDRQRRSNWPRCMPVASRHDGASALTLPCVSAGPSRSVLRRFTRRSAHQPDSHGV